MNAKALAREIAAHRRGRVPRELRRQQVLAEAHDLFIERGFAAASMDELARRVGVSKPVIYELAGSKEQLLKDVMATVDEELTAAVAAAVASEVDPAGRLRAGILAFLRFVGEREAGWTALLSGEAGLAGTEHAALRRRQAERVAALIAASAGDAVTPPDPLTSVALAQAVNGAVEFVALWWLEHREIPAEAIAELLTRAFSPSLSELSSRPLS